MDGTTGRKPKAFSSFRKPHIRGRENAEEYG